MAVINTVCTGGENWEGVGSSSTGGAVAGHGGRGHNGSELVVSGELRMLREAQGLELGSVLFDPLETAFWKTLAN